MIFLLDIESLPWGIFVNSVELNQVDLRLEEFFVVFLFCFLFFFVLFFCFVLFFVLFFPFYIYHEEKTSTVFPLISARGAYKIEK